MVSRQRGRPGNHQLARGIQTPALALVREHYADFGPTLAQEKLSELHSIEVGRETLRKWMVAGGLWLTRRDRLPAVLREMKPAHPKVSRPDPSSLA